MKSLPQQLTNACMAGETVAECGQNERERERVRKRERKRERKKERESRMRVV